MIEQPKEMVSKAQAPAVMLALLLIVAALAAQPKRASPGTASLSGSVSDQRLGRAVEGVTVFLRDYDRKTEATTKTDAEGRYTFTQLADGNYHVIAAHSGYVAQQHGVAELTNVSAVKREGLIPVIAGEHVTGINFQLIKGGTIRGRITSPEGQPIAGAAVYTLMVAGTDSQLSIQPIVAGGNNRTSSTGEFVLDGLAEGFYQVSAMPPPAHDTQRRDDSEFRLTYFPGTPRSQAVAIRVTGADVISGLDFSLMRTDFVTIAGHVARMDSIAPIEGFVVARASTRRLTIAANGAFAMPGLEKGSYRIWARAKTAGGYEAAWETVDAVADVPFLQLTMSPTATIAGRVMTVDGTPLPVDGFRVAAAWTADGSDVDPIARDQAVVAADGTFVVDGVFGDRTIRLIGLPAGWEIDHIAGAKRETNPLRLTAGERVEIVVMIGRTAIRGRVTTPEGQPLANARVTATMVDPLGNTDPDRTTSATTRRGTTENGEYTLRGLSDGLYLLEARVETPRDPRSGLLLPGESEFLPTYFPGGSREDAIAVRVARGEVVANITIPLARQALASITGYVTRRDHQHRIDAHLLAPDSADQAVPIDADGRFAVNGLKPGRYAIWARTPTVNGLEAAFALVEVAAEPIEVELVMTPTATITGRIIAADGSSPPLANVRVAGAWTYEGKDVDVVWRDQTDVDADGRFELEGLFGERTLQVIDLPAGWAVEAIVQDGQPTAIVKLLPGAQAEVTILVRAGARTGSLMVCVDDGAAAPRTSNAEPRHPSGDCRNNVDGAQRQFRF